MEARSVPAGIPAAGVSGAVSKGSELVAFLQARLAADEAVANAAHGIWKDDGDGNIADVSYMAHLAVGPFGKPIDAASRTHILRQQPSRTLRDVEAGRAILAAYEEALHIQAGYKEVSAEEANREALEMVCRRLAAVYGDHPDYRQEWKP